MTATPQTASSGAIRAWLLAVAVLIAAMVLIGGATRLTESGLSIVEWKPVTGALPPLSQSEWERAFAAYKLIPQYRQLNAGMSLSDFKTIFWWEWSHRLLGRVIGAVYLLPFLYFLWRGGVSTELRRRLWLIFGLGALQGAVGWWMVASGLSQRVEVSHYRLAAHLVKVRTRVPIQTTQDLVRAVESIIPKRGPKNPATKVFQALRIAVNAELSVLERALHELSDTVKPGGRMAVITFHSLEDRIVKRYFREVSQEWVDRPEWPAPRRNPAHAFRLITSRPIEPSEEEVRQNSRARSAKLRVIERIGYES